MFLFCDKKPQIFLLLLIKATQYIFSVMSQLNNAWYAGGVSLYFKKAIIVSLEIKFQARDQD